MLAEPMPNPAPAGEPSPVGSYFGLFARAIAAAFIGSADDARRLYPILAERLGVTMYGFFDLQISERIAGMVAATAEQWEDAERHFVEAARIAREAPNRWDAPHVEYWHGKMLLDRGRPVHLAGSILVVAGPVGLHHPVPPKTASTPRDGGTW